MIATKETIDIARAYVGARAAQTAWSATPLDERLRAIRHVRNNLATCARPLAEVIAETCGGTVAEILSSQVLPLADALSFLERNARRILRTRELGGRGRPLWLHGCDTTISREPYGIVLLIAASNYPLFLPGVQLFQALTAGNAVLLKPAPDGVTAARLLSALCTSAGIHPRLVATLPATGEAGETALDLPIDKVVFTGSFETGTHVLSKAAACALPVTAELSGCDAVFVREDADLALTARALAFGLRFNQSATCIAPRRVFAARKVIEQLEAELVARIEIRASSTQPADATEAIREALADGASLLCGGPNNAGEFHMPCVLSGTAPTMRVMQLATFAPLLSMTAVDSDDEALAMAADCPFALGASIFSRNERAARALAGRVRAGVVTINDLIVPTADPRIPFGGRGESGIGVTRGEEGLLEMTTPKVVQQRRGSFRPHFETPTPGDETLFADWMNAAHGGAFLSRMQARWRIVRQLLQRATKRRKS